MRFRSLMVTAAGIALLDPAVASAQNTSFAAAVNLLVGQTPIRVTLATGSATRFYSAPVVQNRSYCAEATASESEVNPADPTLTLFRQDQTTSIGTDTGTTTEPKSQTGARICFIAPATETVFMRLMPFDATFENREYTMRFVETTLWANWWFVGGDYSSFTLLRNTTNMPLTMDLRWRDAAGAQTATRLAQTLPANGVVFIDARTAMSCPFPMACVAAAGSVEVAHDGSPEAIVGSQTTLSSITGLSFDTILFQRKTW